MTHATALRASPAILLVGSLVACTDGDASPGPTDDAAPVTALAQLVSSYCVVQDLRRAIAEGEVDVDALPEWADRTEVEGTPLVVDFTQRLPRRESGPQMLDRLLEHEPLRRFVPDQASVRERTNTTTDADIERTQGGSLTYDLRRR